MIDDFKRDGYVIDDTVLDPDDLDYLTDELSSLRRSLAGRDIGELYDAAFRMPTFLNLISGRAMRLMVNYLMDRDGYAPLYATANRILIAPPGDERRTWRWHRETPYTVPGSRFIQTWFPVVHDSSAEDGTIQVCPGSHLDTDPGERWVEESGRVRQCVVSEEAVARYRPISIPMRLGQCLFFDSRLFHRSGVNTSGRTRFSGVGMYHDVDSPGFKPPSVRYEYR